MNEMKTASAKPEVYVFNGADLIEFHKSSYRTCHEFGTVIDAPELIVDMVVRERRPQPPAAGWLRAEQTSRQLSPNETDYSLSCSEISLQNEQ
jgi:hypothetical protein